MYYNQDMVKYRLRKHVLGGPYLLNLRKADFDKYLHARNIILMAINIEEAFDVLIDNYLEFETTLLQSTNHYLIRFIDDHETFQSERRLFNRKLINLLTTSRAYLDQTSHQLSNNFGESSAQYTGFNEKRELEYAAHLGYRVMEAVRNHVQHYGWPIHSVEYHSQLMGEIAKPKFLFAITPFMKTKYLEEDKEFKSTVLSELKSVEKQKGIDLRPIIRDYIEALADIHTKVRALIQEHIKESEELFIVAIRRFQKKYPGVDPYGLELIVENNGEIITAVFILKEFVESLKTLEKKNKNLVNLSKRYVTNEIIEK